MHHTFANTKRYAEITEAMIKTAMGFFLWPRFPMSNTATATGNGSPANQDRRSMHAKKSPSWLCAAHSLTCTGGHLRELCRCSDLVCNCIQNRACCKHETSRWKPLLQLLPPWCSQLQHQPSITPNRSPWLERKSFTTKDPDERFQIIASGSLTKCQD